MTATYLGAGPSSSDAVIHNGIVYLPSIMSDNGSSTPSDQADDIFRMVEKVLEDCGTTKRKMLSATIFCSDARFFDEVNSRWDAWVPWHDPPACTYLVVKLASLGKRVSIQVTAAL